MKLKGKDEIMSKVLDVLDDQKDIIICSQDHIKEKSYHEAKGWIDALEWVLGYKEEEWLVE